MVKPDRNSLIVQVSGKPADVGVAVVMAVTDEHVTGIGVANAAGGGAPVAYGAPAFSPCPKWNEGCATHKRGDRGGCAGICPQQGR